MYSAVIKGNPLGKREDCLQVEVIAFIKYLLYNVDLFPTMFDELYDPIVNKPVG